FFFSSRRRHTRLQGDWSSDVCSSDLSRQRLAGGDADSERHDRGGRSRTGGGAGARGRAESGARGGHAPLHAAARGRRTPRRLRRSEERRVGKEWSTRWVADPCVKEAM